MEGNIKFTIICASAAAVLSFLLGIITGVGFLSLLFRGLLMGVLFGGLAYGAFFLVSRFLPELLEALTGEAGEFSGAAAGDGPEGAAQTGSSGALGSASSSDEPVTGGRVDIVLEGDESEAESIDSFAEEAPEDGAESAGREGKTADPEGPEAPGEEGEPEELEVVEAAGDAAAGDADVGPEGGTLPDIENMADNFTVSTDNGDAELSSIDGGAASVDIDGQSQDSATVAKAIQTMLKKDQEG